MSALIARANPYLVMLGVGWLVPVLKIVSGDSPGAQMKELWRELGAIAKEQQQGLVRERGHARTLHQGSIQRQISSLSRRSRTPLNSATCQASARANSENASALQPRAPCARVEVRENGAHTPYRAAA